MFIIKYNNYVNKTFYEKKTIKYNINFLSKKYGFKYLILHQLNNINICFLPLEKSHFIPNVTLKLKSEFFHLDSFIKNIEK